MLTRLNFHCPATKVPVLPNVYQNWATEGENSVAREPINADRVLDEFDEELLRTVELSDLDIDPTVDYDSDGETAPLGLGYDTTTLGSASSVTSRYRPSSAFASSSKTTVEDLESVSHAARTRKRKSSIDTDELRRMMEGRACGTPPPTEFNPWTSGSSSK